MKKLVMKSILSWERLTEETAQCTLCFDSRSEIFKGHFPSQAIIPGVLELEIVRTLSEEMSQQPLDITTVSKAKFLKPLLPDIAITTSVSLQHIENGMEVSGDFSDADGKAADIRLHLKYSKKN